MIFQLVTALSQSPLVPGIAESASLRSGQPGSGVSCVQTRMVLSSGLTTGAGPMSCVLSIFPRFASGMSPPWSPSS